jgi:uncharacterized protein YbjT (DUF2867 family)
MSGPGHATESHPMIKVLILGANGQLARNTTRVFLRDTDASLTLYLHRASRLTNPAPDRVTIAEGDVLDRRTLETTMKGQDVVYANLAGAMRQQAEGIVDAMHATGVRRLIFISSMGIYGEVPGESYSSVLDPYRDSAALIEASDLDYTILRPGWFTRDEAVAYRTTQKGEPFKGHEVSLNSLSDLIVKLALTPGMEIRRSLGVSRG